MSLSSSQNIEKWYLDIILLSSRNFISDQISDYTFHQHESIVLSASQNNSRISMRREGGTGQLSKERLVPLPFRPDY